MYKYKNLELTPIVFKELLIEKFDGKQFKRSDAIKIIIEYHVNNGGICEKNEYIGTFKKATMMLQGNGIINCGYGVWKLNYKESEIEVYEIEKKIEKIDVDEEYGEGQCAVYVYYYNIYKELAKLKNETCFPCKIGRTDREPLQRIMAQSGTCYPEKPHIALLFHCENSYNLEKAFHSILKARNKWLKNAPGIEWFNTNIKEIKEIYNFIRKEA